MSSELSRTYLVVLSGNSGFNYLLVYNVRRI